MTEPISGPEIAGIVDELRFRLFRFSVLGGLALVGAAVVLSILVPRVEIVAAILAGVLMAAPLLIVSRRQLPSWRAVCRHPGWTLLIGPLYVAAGLLAERSAFLYPSQAWIAAAVIAGGFRWGLAAAVTLTVATTTTALLGGVSLEAALLELPTGLPARLFLAAALATLAEGLAQIVWIRALAATPRSEDPCNDAAPPSPGANGARRARGAAEDPDLRDAVVVDDVELADVGDVLAIPTPTNGALERDRRAPSVREREVIALLAAGMSLAQAADALGITYRAARARSDRARGRAQARTTPELVSWATVNGFVPRPPEADASR